MSNLEHTTGHRGESFRSVAPQWSGTGLPLTTYPVHMAPTGSLLENGQKRGPAKCGSITGG